MTLAVILFVGISCTTSAPPLVAVAPVRQSAQPPAAAEKPNTATEPAETKEKVQEGTAQDSSTPLKATPSTSAPAQGSSAQKAATPHRRRKKKAVASNCVSAPPAGVGTTGSANGDSAASGSTTTGSASSESPDAANGGTPTATIPNAPTICPPSKVIVRQGGSAEPSIQLAGGAVGDQAARQRDTANRMLGATQLNLKKIAGLQLNPKQQDMVSQIRQFVAQSKSAVAAGDFERARTLAWKAQLLSEELVQPPTK